MNCLDCDGKTKVVDSIAYAGSVYRNRKCTCCGLKFWTEELEVIDKDLLKKVRRHKVNRYKKENNIDED